MADTQNVRLYGSSPIRTPTHPIVILAAAPGADCAKEAKRLCRLLESTQPSAPKVGQERLSIHTHGRGCVYIYIL